MSTQHNLTESDRTMLNATQRRANNHGFAVAMHTPPVTTADIRKVARSLDYIITDNVMEV